MAENPADLTRRELVGLIGGAVAALAAGGLSGCAVNDAGVAASGDGIAMSVARAVPRADQRAVSLKAQMLAEDAALAAAIENLPWNLRLVNRSHPWTWDETVDLVTVKEGEWLEEGRVQKVDARILESLMAMIAAARKDGVRPVICSSFRTEDYQRDLFEAQVACVRREEGLKGEAAEQEAARWVAPPGASEHHTGLAVDIYDADYPDLDRKQESTATQHWLMEHCADHGFILRYPTDKSAVTGIGYEPWHYRYVGEEAAALIAESGLCFEEWLASSCGA